MTTQRLVDLTVAGTWRHKSQLQPDHDHSAPCRSNWFQRWLMTSQAPAAGLTNEGSTNRTALSTFRCRLSVDVTVSNSSLILVLLRHCSICSNRTGTEGPGLDHHHHSTANQTMGDISFFPFRLRWSTVSWTLRGFPSSQRQVVSAWFFTPDILCVDLHAIIICPCLETITLRISPSNLEYFACMVLI